MTDQPAVPRLILRGITKRYPTILANDAIDLEVGAGEIHALMGENGAGKSTLMKIVYGVTRPDAGSIEWEGRRVTIHSPAQARRLGVGMVFQHFALFETLNVAENIALALDERITPAALAPRIDAVAQRYGLPIDPQRLVHSMSVGERQRVEIVRCLLQSPKLLIMDEPTSVLTPQAVRQLFDTLRRLATEGTSILYISHKLEEIRSLCDRATVLRAGRVSGTARPRELDNAGLARLMVGGDLTDRPLQPREAGEVRLELKDYSMAARDPFGTALRQINLDVRAGEIVGIAGVSGNGQKELLAALSGESVAAHEGSISLCGRRVDAIGAAQRRALGLGIRARGAFGARRRAGHVPRRERTAHGRARGHGAARCRPAQCGARARRARRLPLSRSSAAASCPRPNGSPAATCRNSSWAVRSGLHRRSCWQPNPRGAWTSGPPN